MQLLVHEIGKQIHNFIAAILFKLIVSHQILSKEKTKPRNWHDNLKINVKPIVRRGEMT